MDASTLAAALAASDLSLAQVATEAIGQAGANDVDFSLAALFWRATMTVKIVMLVLILASFWSWAIIVDKALAFSRLGRASSRFESDFWSGQPLDQIHERIAGKARTPMERVFDAGMTEWNRSFQDRGGLIPGAQQRIDRAMNVAIARESETLTKRLPFLATVGAVAPFVGLFGTVWGIKHAFEEIAIQQNTNLAVVAPGIAEALLATALGLLAAIPAVVAYNRLAADAERLTHGLENFADEFSTILGRQIGRQEEKAA